MTVQRQSLSRVLGRTDVIALAFGTMVGWGWIMLAGSWISQAGLLGAILAFGAGTILCILVGLTYAELTAALPLAGGEMVYSYRAGGFLFSWFSSWTTALAYIGVAAWESIAIATAIDYIFPLPKAFIFWTVSGNPVSIVWTAVGVLCAILLSVLNYFGTKPSAIFQVMATSAIALVGFIFLFGSFTYGELENIGPLMKDNLGLFSVLLIVPSMLIGFDTIPQSAEEMNLPKKEIGRALVVSIVMGGVWYILMMIGIALSAPEWVRDNALVPVADSMAFNFGSKEFGNLLILGGIFAILTSWNGFILGATRIIFAMGRAKMLPAVFGKLHPKYQTPTAAIVLVGTICALGPFFGRYALVWLVNISAFAAILAYLTVAISFFILRKKEPELIRPFQVKFGNIVAFLVVFFTIAAAILFIFPSKLSLKWPYEWIIIIIWYIIGIVLAIRAKFFMMQDLNQTELLIFGDAYARVHKDEK